MSDESIERVKWHANERRLHAMPGSLNATLAADLDALVARLEAVEQILTGRLSIADAPARYRTADSWALAIVRGEVTL